MRIGVTPWPGHAFVYLAQELGYFEEESCRIRLLTYSSMADAQRAYFRRQLHGMYGTQVELLQICNRNLQQPCAVHVTDYSYGGNAIVAHGHIRSIDDLRGRAVGCEPGSVSVFVVAHALHEAGMSISDVELVHCDQHELQQRFRAGELAAVVSYPPVSHDLQGFDHAHVLYCTRSMPQQVVDLLFVESWVAEMRPDEIAGMIRAFDRAVAFAVAQPEEAAQIMAPYLQISPRELREVLACEVKLVSLLEQQEYFEGRKLQDILAQSAKVLHSAGQLNSDLELGNCHQAYPSQLALKQAVPPQAAGREDDPPGGSALPVRAAANAANAASPLTPSAP